MCVSLAEMWGLVNVNNAEVFCSYRYVEISKMVEHNTQHVSRGKDVLITTEIFVWILKPVYVYATMLHFV